MGRKENGQNYKLVMAVIVLSLIFLCLYGIQGIYGFSLFPDEFGYWASAARFLGYDFSEISSIGSFYSFGYSLILSPILMLFEDSVIAYRAAVVVNLCLQVAAFFVLTGIMGKLFDVEDRTLKALLAGLAVLYPSWVFYTQMTMSEALLFFMYTLVVYAMLSYLEKPTLVKGALLALASVYTYSVHMRAVGILAAVFIIVVLQPILEREKGTSKKAPLLVSALLLIAGFCICLYIKEAVIDALYSSGRVDFTFVNDYSGQTGKLRELFSLMGIGRFLVSMCGKILYLGCGTFGTAYIGIYHLLKRSVKRDMKALFVLLASFMQFMVMCVYLIHSADLTAVRYDLFLHGRYFDFVVPLLVVAGVKGLISEEGDFRKAVTGAVLIGFSGEVAGIAAGLNKAGFSDPHGMLMIGMSYFLDEENVRPVRTIILNIVFSLLILCIIEVVVSVYKRNRNVFILCILHLMLVGMAYHACNHFIYIGQSYIYGDIQVADEIKELRSSGHEGDIILVYGGELEYIDTVQLRLRDEHIHVVYADDKSAIEDLTSKDLVLVHFESELNTELSEMYDSSWESGHFDLYYNYDGGRNK